jgi:hypothetical protein
MLKETLSKDLWFNIRKIAKYLKEMDNLALIKN